MTDEHSQLDTTKEASPAHVSIDHLCSSYVTRWGLRVLLRMNFKERFFETHDILSNFDILQTVGLLDYYDNELSIQPEGRKKLIGKMDEHLARLNDSTPQADDVILCNIQLLQKSLSLAPTDTLLLHLAAAVHQNNGLATLFEMIGEVNFRQAKHLLAIILATPLSLLERSLSKDGVLYSSGLFNGEYLQSRLPLLRYCLSLSDNIASALSRPHTTQASLLQSFFRPSPAPRLAPADYQHIAHDFTLTQNYLKSAIKQRTPGVNILIYGAPGTGKTEMVRTLCHDAQLHLHEIAMEDQNGHPIHGPERFMTLRLSQRLLQESTSGVLLFDEVEDVFPVPQQHFFEPQKTGDVKKSWINNVLETNTVPTFWLCNHTHQIDPSYLRRFDVVLQLRSLNSDVRLRIIKKYLGDLPVSEHWLSKMSEQTQLAPALVEKAVKVANHLELADEKETEAVLDKIIKNSLEVMGLPRHTQIKAPQHTAYNLDYVNPDTDLDKICQRFNENSTAKICLYGPPGTGKTAFAHHVAKVLGKSILVKRASDILSKWVGEAEKNIANMFEEATQNGQILLLDEADSFLQERQSAGQAWEVTQVNEMLVQMEVFNGIFIASTNLRESLDAASLRRFDFKIKFDFMTRDQSLQLFSQVLQENGLPVELISEDHKKELFKMDKLTAGDFATVIRQSLCLSQTLSTDILLDGLHKEIQAKPNYNKPIGFF
jgi:SpoVK/Ycf46/Vps4 family AAA+-type ATPase